MASFDDIGSGSITNFGDILSNIAVNTFDRMVRGIVFEMLSTHVNDFNLMNHDFMNFHMLRNAYEKEITLNTLGENAYTDGNPDTAATPAQYPSYTRGNNYMEFITNTREAEKNGELTTRLQKAGEENTNFYLDADSDEIDNKVQFTGSYLDRNSILYKTKKLMRQHKLKTIISEFHTDPSVEYNGQIGSKYGESHGRNLLTKNADNSSNDYTVNGYDNPYCRVWTHHYKYDKIEKTIRANSDDLGHWANFEWDETDKGHKKDNTKYGDGERYDYAWRGKHNQDRRKEHSVLDPHTGLVNITPQYRGGGELNRHTKDCMFSIENLAWKDYDPYSFEQALSWEQRGPLGGRIMWFPPYGIEVSETATARWQTNDFIGRGEPVYTYINSERSGNLSFIMITDHPSSVDYASWWDDNNLIKGVDDGQGNTENDYLRYFAGCANNDNNGDGNGEDGDDGGNGVKEGKTGGLIIKPTPMTDEYIRINPPLIEKEVIPTPEPEPPEPEPVEDKNPTYVEFFVFFPNNYSGVWDKPTNQNSAVNAIAYLLGGSNTMKQDQVDVPFDIDSQNFQYENSDTIGYEMEKGPITTDNVYGFNTYIQGGKLNTKTYVPDPDKKWCYRIDHKQPYAGGNSDPKNTINQKILKANLKDTKTNKTNLFVNSSIESHAVHKDNLYSFAEVSAALYSQNILNQPLLYQYLIDCGVDTNKVDTLIELFTSNNQKLTEILCEGAASSHGDNIGNKKLAESRNNSLSVNRANTVLNWVRTNTVCGWDKLENTWDGTPKIIPVDAKDKKNVNGDSAKLGRCAHCVMKFTSGSTQTSTDPLYFKQLDEVEITADRTEQPDIVGFTFIESKPQPNGQIWHYYKKDGSITYYDQEANSVDNYDKPGETDVVVNESQISDIFKSLSPKKVQVIKMSSNYRGLYDERGFYIEGFNYQESDEPMIMELSYTESKSYWKGLYVYDGGRLYTPLADFYCDVTGKTKEDIWADYGDKLNDISNLMNKYSEGDFVLVKNGSDETFYKCSKNYTENYPDFNFDANEWDEVTTDNINDAIVSPYSYVDKDPEDTQVNEIIYDTAEQVFKLCSNIDTNNPPYNDKANWESIIVTEFENGMFLYTGEYVTHENELYVCVDDTEYSEEFDARNWELLTVLSFCNTCTYKKDDIVKYTDSTYYKCKKDITTHHFTTDLSVAMPKLVKDSDNTTGKFDGNYPYEVGDYCLNGTKYYKSKVDFYEKSVQTIPFETALQNGSWEEASDSEMNSYIYSWELAGLVKKAAAVLCLTVDEMIKRITGDADVNFDETDTYSCIWKYGVTNGLVTREKVNTSTDLVAYATKEQPSSASSIPTESSIKFTSDEDNYLGLLVNKKYSDLTVAELRTYIILYRILDGINSINDSKGTRKVCDSAAENEEEMKEKTTRIDESETKVEGCVNIWVDRGDGLLIQECNITEDGEDRVISRFNAETGEGNWNKLRYDQEYHFYKQYMIDHPLIFEKLQEKIKYFNPAFHSMTPEGFNARCTFLQQCTRQGNTKTMSDSAGRTANNLAFGRAPYCVLRLGDFYNQMIVIESVSFDYNISNGLQWDMNPEGNGLQPMLCKVNISFKFIGGGDITGPVQRLQNAMSFNYYANTSFYDNRADRIEYQPTNWKTMGGAGNNEVDLDKSYAYITQNYEQYKSNIVKHD